VHTVPASRAYEQYRIALDEGRSLVSAVAGQLRELGIADIGEEIVAGSAATVILDMVETRAPIC